MAENDKIKSDITLAKRYIYFKGEVSEESSAKFIEDLLRLELQDPTKDILVIINSYGGYVDSMWSMVDVMNLVSCQIHTFCVGTAMSAASVILLNGTKGKRYCTPNSRIMIHEISAGAHGNVSYLETQTKETSRMQKQLEDFICIHSKYTKQELKKTIQQNQDIYLPAQDALRKGVIDKIITKFSDLKLKGW